MTLPVYFLLDAGLWVFTAGIGWWAWPRLNQRWRLTSVLTAVVVMACQVFNEILSLKVFHAWSFCTDHNCFIGWTIAGIPVEEYLFWFAFAWFLPWLYSGLQAGDPRRLPAASAVNLTLRVWAPRPAATGRRLYLMGWVVGVLIQVLVCLPIVIKKIDWRALCLTSAVLIVMMFGIETAALHWKWWVWDEQQLLGPKVGLIPLEEFLLYWLVVPSVATIQLLIDKGCDFLKIEQ